MPWLYCRCVKFLTLMYTNNMNRWYFHMSTLAAKSQFILYLIYPEAICAPRMSTQNNINQPCWTNSKTQIRYSPRNNYCTNFHVGTRPETRATATAKRRKKTSNFPLCLEAILFEPNWKCIHNIYMAAFHPKNTTIYTHNISLRIQTRIEFQFKFNYPI